MRMRLKEARKNIGLTQQLMADKLKITLRYYQQIEAGDRTGDYWLWDAIEDMTGIHQRELRVLPATEKPVLRKFWNGRIKMDGL